MCKMSAACLAVLFVSAAARADLVASSSTGYAYDVRGVDLPSLQLPFAARAFESGSIATIVASELADDFASDSGGAQLTTLPPAPDSSVLALSGLLSLGAIQLGRNVRKLHLGALPEWYHDGAVQVGHSTPFDLDLGFNLAALPVCIFTQPAQPKGPVFIGAQWPDAARCAPQFQPNSESPRAPPKHS